MIREDRELLAELARLNTAMPSLAMRMMDGSASVVEQHDYAQRLIAAGERMRKRAKEMAAVVIEPPFTWEAIMELGKVDELIRVLGLAREEARQSVTVGVTRADRGGKGIVREIRNLA